MPVSGSKQSFVEESNDLKPTSPGASRSRTLYANMRHPESFALGPFNPFRQNPKTCDGFVGRFKQRLQRTG
jgi:hypothetical protein